MRILRIQQGDKALCPKTNELIPVCGRDGNHCSPHEVGSKTIEAGCEHYKYLPTKEFMEEKDMGQEYLEAWLTHIVCGYDGPIHPDWQEPGLRRDWAILVEDISEEKRIDIIKESGTDNPKPRTELSPKNELNPNNPVNNQTKMRGKELERQVLEDLDIINRFETETNGQMKISIR